MSEQTKREENKFFKNILFFIKKDIGTAITLGYLLLIIIGMMFRNNFYSRFNINIFDFADIKDFVLAPFEDTYILIFTAGSILIFYLFIEIQNHRIRKGGLNSGFFYKFPMFIRKFIPEFLITLLGIAYYIHASAGVHGKMRYEAILNSTENNITITFDEIEIPKEEIPILIGITSSYTFIYFKNKKESYAIANDKVKAFKFLTEVKE